MDRMNARGGWGWGSRNLALAALGFNAAASFAWGALFTLVLVTQSQAVADFYNAASTVATLQIFIGALGFLPWLSKTFDRARVLDTSAATVVVGIYSRQQPVLSYFIPFVNLVRPYRAMRALDAGVDPDRAPLPEPRLEEEFAGTYRAQVPYAAPDLRDIPAAPVRAWWALWIGRPIVAIPLILAAPNAQTVLFTLDAAAAVVACMVVWRVDRRLEESLRRRAVASQSPSSS